MDALAGLNANQRRAVEATDGPVMIIAGPGTGKTKTLTLKIMHIITAGLARPNQILALTFTNKAAGEIQQRLAGQISRSAGPPLITTFHALGYQILGHSQALIDDMDRLDLLRRLTKHHADYKGVSLRELSLEISRVKNRLDDAPPSSLVQDYNDELARRHLFDYDDLLGQAYRLLQGDPNQRQAWQRRLRYVLVDEFQDSNQLQYALVKLLLSTGNLTVIGDPRQSIYAWRGADADVFKAFTHDWPDHQAITLEANYRSGSAILQLAQAIFPDAPPLVPQVKIAGRVSLIETLDEHTEAAWVVNHIEQGLGGTDLLRSGQAMDAAAVAAQAFSDFAVVYRTRRYSQVLARKLADSGLPYQVVGEDSPYGRTEVKLILNLLQFIQHQGDDQLSRLAELLKWPAGDVRSTLAPLVRERDGLHVGQLAQQCLELVNLADRVGEDSELGRDLRQFMNGLRQFDEAGLAAALRYYDELAQADFYDAQADLVTLMTIHAAKGLEFAHVIITGFEEGLLPMLRAGREAANLDEEQRLFYVAATRARTGLTMLHARHRAGQTAIISRFGDLVRAGGAEVMVDEGMAKALRRREQWQQQHRQASLF